MKKIKCYTDGACSYNPGAGGFGIIFLKDDNKISSTFYGGYGYTTNNRMELTAVIKAIEMAKASKYDEIEINSDSAYVINAITNNWISKWQSNNWLTAKNELVKNKDLWLKYMKIVNDVKVSFVKIKGHAGEKYNELVDKLAVRGSKDILDEIIQEGKVYRVSQSEN